MNTEAYIFEAVRTPHGTGKSTGSLHEVTPISLVVGLIDELRVRFPDLDEDRIADVVLGCVTPVGGTPAFLVRADQLAKRYGPRFRVPESLRAGER